MRSVGSLLCHRCYVYPATWFGCGETRPAIVKRYVEERFQSENVLCFQFLHFHLENSIDCTYWWGCRGAKSENASWGTEAGWIVLTVNGFRFIYLRWQQMRKEDEKHRQNHFHFNLNIYSSIYAKHLKLPNNVSKRQQFFFIKKFAFNFKYFSL